MHLAAIAFWLAIWQAASVWVGQEILLVSPVKAFKTLLHLLGKEAFYLSVFGSLKRIALGFILALAAGVLLAGLSKWLMPVRVLLNPPMQTIKAIPVASFVVLALIWTSSRNLSILISFLMVLPVVYGNFLDGLSRADAKLLQMAQVFRVGRLKRIWGIYLPSAFPHLLSAMRLSLGLCWKAGIAAEVIGQPRQSIGSSLHSAKITFNTPELFAWTIAIVCLSVLFEKLIVWSVDALRARVEGGSKA